MFRTFKNNRIRPNKSWLLYLKMLFCKRKIKTYLLIKLYRPILHLFRALNYNSFHIDLLYNKEPFANKMLNINKFQSRITPKSNKITILNLTLVALSLHHLAISPLLQKCLLKPRINTFLANFKFPTKFNLAQDDNLALILPELIEFKRIRHQSWIKHSKKRMHHQNITIRTSKWTISFLFATLKTMTKCRFLLLEKLNLQDNLNRLKLFSSWKE